MVPFISAPRRRAKSTDRRDTYHPSIDRTSLPDFRCDRNRIGKAKQNAYYYNNLRKLKDFVNEKKAQPMARARAVNHTHTQIHIYIYKSYGNETVKLPTRPKMKTNIIRDQRRRRHDVFINL